MNGAIRVLLCGVALLPGLAVAQTNGPTAYRAISERNAFGLKPASAAALTETPAPEPKEDLLLTGLTDFGRGRCASFMLVEPGKPARFFTLHEGEQNDWLEVISIQVDNATVKGRLKKPVVRMRAVGVDVILTFQPRPKNPSASIVGQYLPERKSAEAPLLTQIQPRDPSNQLKETP